MAVLLPLHSYMKNYLINFQMVEYFTQMLKTTNWKRTFQIIDWWKRHIWIICSNQATIQVSFQTSYFFSFTGGIWQYSSHSLCSVMCAWQKKQNNFYASGEMSGMVGMSDDYQDFHCEGKGAENTMAERILQSNPSTGAVAFEGPYSIILMCDHCLNTLFVH